MSNLSQVKEIFIQYIKNDLLIEDAYKQLCNLGLKLEDISTEIHKIYDKEVEPTSIDDWIKYIELTTRFSDKIISSYKVINFPINPTEEGILSIIAMYEELFGVDDDMIEKWPAMSAKDKYDYITSFDFCK